MEWKFMAALWTFNHVTLDKRWTPGASEDSTIGNIKNKTTLRTTYHVFSFFSGTQAFTPICKACMKTIKIFPKYKVEAQNCEVNLIDER